MHQIETCKNTDFDLNKLRKINCKIFFKHLKINLCDYFIIFKNISIQKNLIPVIFEH